MLTYNHYNQNRHDETWLGIYRPNGVWAETEQEYGISFAVDQLLYNALAEALEDTGCAWVYASTEFGYSQFLIACAPENAEYCYTQTQRILTGDLPEETDPVWMPSRRNVPNSLQQRYDGVRYPGSRLAHPVSRRGQYTFSREQLLRWHEAHGRHDGFLLCVTGAEPPCQLETATPWVPLSSSSLTAALCTPIRHIPGTRADVVVSLPLPHADDGHLTAMALCQLLRPRLAWETRAKNGIFGDVQVFPYALPELRVHSNYPKVKAEQAAKTVRDTLAQLAQILSPELALEVQGQLLKEYREIAQSPRHWNTLAGRCLMTGRLDDPDMLIDPAWVANHITAEKLTHLINQLLDAPMQIFATAVR